MTFEETFAKLVALVEGLDEEQHRAAEEGLSEDELVLFDLLKEDKLTQAERERVKVASRELLASLQRLIAPLRRGHAHARGLLIEAAHSATLSPGPLRAFFRRIEHRRGYQIALVAVARKLAVLAWYILSTGERYRYERTTVVLDKRQRLVRTAGQQVERRRRAAGEPTLATLREQELALLAEAEAGYKAEVATRRTRTRPPPKGKRLFGPRRGRVRGGAFVPRRSALSTGSTASEEGEYASSGA